MKTNLGARYDNYKSHSRDINISLSYSVARIC